MPVIPSRLRTAPIKTGLAIRIDLTSGARIGPGKVRLLEEIARTGSISAAGRAMRMGYRHTWLLVNEMNKSIGPVITAAQGGSGGGGAKLTKIGEELVAEYRAIEVAADAASRSHLTALEDDFRTR
jgi:molybdate transport system regulatory protein